MKNKFDVIWSPVSLKQIKWIQENKSSDFTEKYFRRLNKLIDAIQDSPFDGIGKPEHLKYEIPQCWSRRINKKDRIIYRIKRDSLEIVSIMGHYD